jgi:hypothetical protein
MDTREIGQNSILIVILLSKGRYGTRMEHALIAVIRHRYGYENS